MQLIRLLSNFLSQHVSGIIMLITRRIRPWPTACGVLSIRCLLSNFLSQHVSGIIMSIIRRIRQYPTACGVLPVRQNTACSRNGLILLMMGIMMPETCWNRKFDNKHRMSCILLVLSLHLMFLVNFQFLLFFQNYHSINTEDITPPIDKYAYILDEQEEWHAVIDNGPHYTRVFSFTSPSTHHASP
jgi:hypothetical protein